MPQILDLSLMSAAQMMTAHPWNALKGRFESATQMAHQSNIMKDQSAWHVKAGQALAPMFTAAGSALGQGIQGWMGGGGGAPTGYDPLVSGGHQSWTGGGGMGTYSAPGWMSGGGGGGGFGGGSGSYSFSSGGPGGSTWQSGPL
jgi:hypothetical protein